MPATPESRARTRAFARVIGPWLVIAPGIIAVRAPDMGTLASDFFENPLIVWFAGALLLFGGLRGAVLLAAPQLIERGAAVSMRALPLVQAGFGAAVLIGLWLTYVGWIAKPPSSPAKNNP
jgi:hypothetical protein